jgi:hypothetical protein
MEITKYAGDALESVKQAGFLNEQDSQDLMAMMPELQDTFEKRQIWRTETEMRVSVLNDLHFSTPAAKYWQAVREQGVFFENLVALTFDYKRNEIKIQRLRRDMAKEKDDLARADLEVDLEECLFRRKNMEVAARDRVREIRLWSRIKAELVDQDQGMDTTDVNVHQLISYGLSFANDFACCNDHTPPADRRNLEGKFKTVIRVLDERGLLDRMPPDWLSFAATHGFIHKKEGS